MREQLELEDEDISITLRRAWDRALRSLATRVNEATFKTHIRAIRPVSLSDEADNGKPVYRITLGVPSAFTREWVEQRHGSLIASILEEILDRDVRVKFTLLPRDNARAVPQTPSLFDDEPSVAPELSKPSKSSKPSAANTPPSAGPPTRRATPASSASSQPPVTPATPPSAAEGETFELTPSPALQRSDTSLPPQPANRPRIGQPGSETPPSGSRTPAQPRLGRNTDSDASGHQTPYLNPRYLFENFIVGHSNRLAHSGARAVAQSPGQVYNPLFLYGPSGLGKTHLMHAIGNEVVRLHGIDPSRIAYISGEAFTSNFITSLREQRADEFRRKWYSVDLWLVDDVQFIAGKERTKEEFFHTFNALYQTGKQIVISSDRSPRELQMMDERLRSRFECGLIADLAAPDLETRLAILQRKAETERMRIPDEVLLYMAKLIQSNIRTLEGALVKLIAYASIQNSPVTTDLASQILERYYISAGIGDTPGGAGGWSGGGVGRSTGNPNGYVAPSGYSAALGITAEMVQRVVAKRYGLSVDALTGKKRDRDIVTARQVAMHLMRELTELSLPGIGQLFGGRDHSTVSHACDRVKSLIPLDDDLRGLIEDLVTQLKAQASG